MDNKRQRNFDETLPSVDIPVPNRSISVNSPDGLNKSEFLLETLNTVDSESYSARSTARCEDQLIHNDVCSFIKSTPDNLHHEDRDTKIQTSNKQSNIETHSWQTEPGRGQTRRQSNTEPQCGQTEPGRGQARKQSSTEPQCKQTEPGRGQTRKQNNTEVQCEQTEPERGQTRRQSNTEPQCGQTEPGRGQTRKQSSTEPQCGQTEPGRGQTRRQSNTEPQCRQTEPGRGQTRKQSNTEAQCGQTEPGRGQTRKQSNTESHFGQMEPGRGQTRKQSNTEPQCEQTEPGKGQARKQSNTEPQFGQMEPGRGQTRKQSNTEAQCVQTEPGRGQTRKQSNTEPQCGQTEPEKGPTRKQSNTEAQCVQTEPEKGQTRKQSNTEPQCRQTEPGRGQTRKQSNTEPQCGQTEPGRGQTRIQSNTEPQCGQTEPGRGQTRQQSNTEPQCGQTEPGARHKRKQSNTETLSGQTEIETRHDRKQSNTETHNGRIKRESKPSHGLTDHRNSDPVKEITSNTNKLLHTAPTKLPSSNSEPSEDKLNSTTNTTNILHSSPTKFEHKLNNCEDETRLTQTNCSEETYGLDSDEHKPKASCSKCQKPAVVYCINCASYMCHRCENRHDKESPLKKKHIKLKGDSFPGSFTVKQINRNEKCPNHSNKDVTYFCEEHTALCCEDCTSQKHASCYLQSLEKLFINTDVKKLKQDSLKHVRTKLESFLKIRQKLFSNNDMSLIEEERIIKEVEESSEQMVKHIRRLEEQFINKIKETLATGREHTKTGIQQCDKYITNISKDVQYIGQPKTTKDNELLTVVKLKQIQKEHLPDYDNVEKTLAGESRKVYEYKINKELCDNVMQSSTMGGIECQIFGLDLTETTDSDEMNTSMYENSPCPSNNCSTCVLPERFVIDAISISCWTEGDIASKTTITAIELLDDGSLIISDQKNQKLKWFDADFKLITFEELSSAPWGITRLSGTMYLVNLPEEQAYLEFEIFAGGLRMGQNVNIGFEFTCAVEIESKRLVFAGFDGDLAQIVTTDMSGSGCRQLLPEKNRALFRRPHHMVKSTMDTKIIYISDVDRGIFAVDTENGNIFIKYSDPTLKCSMGFTINEHMEIVVCSAQSRSLHLVSSTDGTRNTTVALEQIPDVMVPQTICFLPHLGEYLMSSDGSYYIVKFKLG